MKLGGSVLINALPSMEQAQRAGPSFAATLGYRDWATETSKTNKAKDLLVKGKKEEEAQQFASALRLYEAAFLLTNRNSMLLHLAYVSRMLFFVLSVLSNTLRSFECHSGS